MSQAENVPGRGHMEKAYKNYFYVGVLHPVARISSRLLEEPVLRNNLSRCLFYIFF
jgi:hypothetical protein